MPFIQKGAKTLFQPSKQGQSSDVKSYTTKLPAEDEAKFQTWVKQNKIPWKDEAKSDYDMRGYWKAQQSGDPNAKQSSNLHFPDTWKTPYHKTFSNESIYAPKDAPHWENNKLIDKNGKIIADETPKDQSSVQGAPEGIDMPVLKNKKSEDTRPAVESLASRVARAGAKVVAPQGSEAEGTREKAQNISQMRRAMGLPEDEAPAPAPKAAPMAVDKVKNQAPSPIGRIPRASLDEMSKPLIGSTPVYDFGGVVKGIGEVVGNEVLGPKFMADIPGTQEYKQRQARGQGPYIPGIPEYVYDEGGLVGDDPLTMKPEDKPEPFNMTDGQHQVAIVENGERVLTPEQNAQYEKEHGASDQTQDIYIGGNQIKDPNNRAAEMHDDTDIIPSKTRMSGGATIVPAPMTQDTPLKMDISNPAASQMIPGLMQTISAKNPKATTGVPKISREDANALISTAQNSKVPAGETQNPEIPNEIPPTEGSINADAKNLIPRILAPNRPGIQTMARAENDLLPVPTGGEVGNRAALPKTDRAQFLAHIADLEQKANTAAANGDFGREAGYRDEIAQYKSENRNGTPGSSHPGVIGKILNGLRVAGNVAGDVVDPGAMALIPGTDLHNQLERKGSIERIKRISDINLQDAEAAEKNAAAKTAANGKVLSPSEQEAQDKLNASRELGQNETRLQDPNLSDADRAKLENRNKQIYAANPTLVPPERQAKDAPATAPVIADYKSRVAQLNLDGDAARVYGTAPAGATAAELDKRYQSAAALKNMNQKDKENTIHDQERKDNEAEHIREHNETRDAKLVNYRGPDGDLLSGTRGEAKDAGVKEKDMHGETTPALQEKARQAYTQYDRMIGNAQEAASTLPAWNNESDRQQAMRVAKMYWDHVGGGVPGTVTTGINPEYLQQAINSDAYRAMSPEGQDHMQNMFQIWSDAINVVKQETGGVPKGQVFLQKEDAILPHPDKTQAMNEKALLNFAKRMNQDSKEYARPSDMSPLQKGIVPSTATHELRDKNHNLVGYVDAKGKDQLF